MSEPVEVAAKAVWDKHRQLYPNDTIIRGEWRADEDDGFLHHRYRLYTEAAILAFLKACESEAVSDLALTLGVRELPDGTTDGDTLHTIYTRRLLRALADIAGGGM